MDMTTEIDDNERVRPMNPGEITGMGDDMRDRIGTGSGAPAEQALNDLVPRLVAARA
jgi:hypothetical protein